VPKYLVKIENEKVEVGIVSESENVPMAIESESAIRASLENLISFIKPLTTHDSRLKTEISNRISKHDYISTHRKNQNPHPAR
jgi:hypothetical protein